MRTIFVVCEGQTEETFVSNVVTPSLYPAGINLIAQLIETSVGHKGGALSYERVLKHLRNNLRLRSQPVVTTLIDLYKLDSGFPGFTASKDKPLAERLRILNEALHQDVVSNVGCRADRFLPYIQPYEFEALLFSDICALTSIESAWADAADTLQDVRDAVESPEHINDGPATKPAAHLENRLANPKYRKALHGPIAAERIGLLKIEAECHYFAGWLAHLRQQTPIVGAP